MTLYPEQQRALDYARKRGTEASAGAIRSRVAGTYAEIEALAGAVDAALARRRPAAASWSVQEVIDHLVESDRPAAQQLERLLAGESVDEAIPASLQSAAPLDLDWPALLHDFREVHQRIVDLLDGAGDEAALKATAPVQMVVKCAMPDGSLTPVQWPVRLDWKAYAILLHAHNREHIAQLQRILAALAA